MTMTPETQAAGSVRHTFPLSMLAQDLRFGYRLLRKDRWLTLVAVLALGMGIGLTAMMYSVIHGMLLRGLPFADGDRIYHVHRADPSQGITQLGVPLHDFLDWREQQRTFEELAGFYNSTINIGDTGHPERFSGGFMTANSFRILGVQPLLGRAFRDGDDAPGAAPVIILGHAAWQNRYGADPDVVGRQVRVNGRTAEIIGVMPQGFRFPMSQDVWVPLELDLTRFDRGEGTLLEVYGRLRPGVAQGAAKAEFDAITQRLEAAHPSGRPNVHAQVIPYTERFVGSGPRQFLSTMLGAVFLVLLIACANVANLLLTRAALRSREVGIRTALGAPRWRVVTQFLAESLALATVGAVLGLVIASVGIRLFSAAIASTNPPFWFDIRLDAPVLLFAAGVTMLAALAAGALPAWQAARADANEVLKDEARGSSSFRMGRLSKGLVVVEVALSCGLLVGAGLMIRSVTNLRTLDLGIPTENVFTARVWLPENAYADLGSRIRFYENLHERIGALPGVQAVSLTSNLPTLGAANPQVGVEGESYADPQRDRQRARRVVVTPGFFDTFSRELREGRDFTLTDNEAGLPVAVVNESLARRHFGAESALGRRIHFAVPVSADTAARWLTIVGVVPDMWAGNIDNVNPHAVYVPLAQSGAQYLDVAARTALPPTTLTTLVRDAVAAIDADIPLYQVRTLGDAIRESTWFFRVFGALFMVFGSVALFLAAIGLYAVMSTSVSRRTREVGVRMALGARRSDVLRLVFRQAMAQVGIGLAFGLALAAAISRLLAVVLFDVEPRDPVIFGAIIIVLALTGAAATFVPARRATRVDPQVALRWE
jgi:putative ABC transport system permease protein